MIRRPQKDHTTWEDLRASLVDSHPGDVAEYDRLKDAGEHGRAIILLQERGIVSPTSFVFF